MRWTKRLFDVVVASVLLILFSPVLVAITVVIRVTSKGSGIYWSDRVGRNNKIFRMPKFRSMRIGAPELATHMLSDPENYVTPIGGFLRRTSLDELPQLFSILAGDLSFVGPRPALFNQDELVALRTARGIHLLVPGLTGWAQVNGRDELPVPTKVDFDYEYMRRQSTGFDLKILIITALKVVRREGISH